MAPIPLSFLPTFDAEPWLNYPLIRFGGTALTVVAIVKIAVWTTAIFAGNIFLRSFVLRRVLERTKFDPGLRFAITKMFGYTFVILGFYLALTVNGVNLSSLAVIAGALGLGIGFGLQNIVANFVSGLVLLAERPVAVGDRIEVAGVAGNVTKINLRSTVVLTNDNISIIVPNLELTSHPITNWSYGDPRVRVRLPVGVAYGTDPEKVRAALLEVAAANPQVLKSPAPSVFFDSFGESALNFELGVWTNEMAHAPRQFRSLLNFAIERKLRESEIEIPFPQRVVHLRGPAGEGGCGKAREE